MDKTKFTNSEITTENAKQSATDSMGRPTISLGAKGKSGKNLGILTLAMFSAGVFLLIWGGYEIKGSLESRNWPSAQGTITSSHVSEQKRRDPKTRRTTITYYPKVSYKYQVDGRYHTSNRIEFGAESGGMKKMAKKTVDKYPAGKKVTVYYNPQDPKYGILEAGFTWSSIIVFLAGITFFGVGIIFFKTYRKNKKKAMMAPFVG